MLPSFLGFYKQVYSAVTDFTSYRNIFEQDLGKTLLYLTFLAVHLAAVLTLTFGWHYGPQVLSITQWARQNFPPLLVEEGRLTIDSQQPVVKTYPGEELVTFVFDTTGTYKDPKELHEPAFLFTEDRLYFRYMGRTQTYLWKDFGRLQIGSAEFEDFRTLIQWAYFPIASGLIFLYTLFAKGMLATILTLIGVSASSHYGLRLPLQQHFTIALYALTPAVIIDLGVTMTGLQISLFSYFMYLVTAAIYTYMATVKCVIVE